MKFLVFWDVSKEDLSKQMEKAMKRMKDLKKNPEKYPKMIFPPHLISTEEGKANGVTIIETDSKEKLIDSLLNVWPEQNCKIVPLLDTAKVGEIYLKMKK